VDVVVVKGPYGITQSLSTLIAILNNLLGATEIQEADLLQRRLNEDFRPVEFFVLFSLPQSVTSQFYV
jgi:hypothetical protein